VESGAVFEFGPFQLVPREHKLLRKGIEVKIQPRNFDVLVLLVQNSPHLVPRAEILKKVWGGEVRSDNILDNVLSELRKLLSPRDHKRYIQNVPKFGFRFANVVRRLQSDLNTDPFVGRESLLAEIGQHLQSHRCVTLFGLSGVGTTRLAREYARQHATDYSDVYKVSAARPAVGAAGTVLAGSTIDAGFRELAVRLKLSRELFDAERVRRSLCKRLNSRPGWLLLIDDVATPEDLDGYLPNASAGHVLITSSFPDWVHSVEVRPFDPTTAAEFLETTTGRRDRPTARMLAEELGCLPRALVQAAAFVRLSNCSLRDYLNMLRRGVQLLGTNEARESPVAVSLGLLLARIRTTFPAGAALMNLVAFFAPQRIPDVAFRDWAACLPEPVDPTRADSPLLFRNALANLRSSSLVSFEPGGFSVNRLVQRLAQHELGGHRSTWVQAALILIHKAFTALSSDPQTWDDCAALLPHALTVAGHAAIHQIEGPQLDPQGPTLHGDLWRRITDYLVARGAPLTVHAEMDQAISLLESVSGTDSADLVGPLNRLASVLKSTYERTRDKKHLEKAGEYQRRAVEIGGSQDFRDLYTKTD